MEHLYVAVDKNVYLGQVDNYYKPVDSIKKAKKFTSAKAVMNTIESCIPQILRKNYNWSVRDINCEHKENDSQKLPESSKEVNALDKGSTFFSIVHTDPKEHNSVDVKKLKWNIEQLSSQLCELRGNKDWLVNELSDVDKQINDILHYIEFNKFSGSYGFKLCKLLKLMRQYRRGIKYELELIDIVNSNNCRQIAAGSTLHEINKLENRKYTPRVLNEFFDNKDIDELIFKYDRLVNKWS